MATDFWAGYISGAIGILIGNPLDIVKTRLQATPVSENAVKVSATVSSINSPIQCCTAFARGAAAPILGYGALNALLFVTYNRSLALLNTGNLNDWPERPSSWSIWTAGALGGLATFFVSAPTELVKCRAQVSDPPQSSLAVTRKLWKLGGLRGLYLGGGITSIRDAVGYGFYFWSYELSRRAMSREHESQTQQALKVLLCGGLAGVVTWASIFPLDVVKTRVQTWDLAATSQACCLPDSYQPLLSTEQRSAASERSVFRRPSTFRIARDAYQSGGLPVFFRGLGVCSARAFIVNAVQWAVYEWMMEILAH